MIGLSLDNCEKFGFIRVVFFLLLLLSFLLVSVNLKFLIGDCLLGFWCLCKLRDLVVF